MLEEKFMGFGIERLGLGLGGKLSLGRLSLTSKKHILESNIPMIKG